jgi:uncharacterized protein (TIGR03083 family)
MSSVRERRESVSRDLDSFLARLHDLRTPQWNLPTPCKGWEIRHLAAHLSGTTALMNSKLILVVQPNIAAAHLTGDDVTADSEHEDIITSLTTNRNALIATLAEFTEDHLTAETGEESTFMVNSGETWLDLATTEAGLHLYDINAALDHGSAGLSSVSLEATNDTYATAMVQIANFTEAKPDTPVSFHFDGDLVDRWMTWTGNEWVPNEVHGTPVTRIHADDSILILFLVGRISPTDHRLGLSGNREPLLTFKTWVPGP